MLAGLNELNFIDRFLLLGFAVDLMAWLLAIACLHRAATLASGAGADESLPQPVTP